jgi:polyisoprenoid-binding protein YceI
MRTPSKITSGLVVSTALTAFALPALAQDIAIPSGTYASDPTHTSLFWSVNHFGLSNYTARINGVDATVELNADDLTQSSVTATIDMAGVDTDYPFPENTDFNAELRGANWLNTDAFPQATFTSTSITRTGDSTALIEGDLTFYGQTLPVTLDTKLIGALESHPFTNSGAFGISATGTFDRTAFGFSTFAPNASAEVTIQINAEFLQQ